MQNRSPARYEHVVNDRERHCGNCCRIIAVGLEAIRVRHVPAPAYCSIACAGYALNRKEELRRAEEDSES